MSQSCCLPCILILKSKQEMLENKIIHLAYLAPCTCISINTSTSVCVRGDIYTCTTVETTIIRKRRYTEHLFAYRSYIIWWTCTNVTTIGCDSACATIATRISRTSIGSSAWRSILKMTFAINMILPIGKSQRSPVHCGVQIQMILLSCISLQIAPFWQKLPSAQVAAFTLAKPFSFVCIQRNQTNSNLLQQLTKTTRERIEIVCICFYFQCYSNMTYSTNI